jgi:hypothetical protein
VFKVGIVAALFSPSDPEGLLLGEVIVPEPEGEGVEPSFTGAYSDGIERTILSRSIRNIRHK